MGFMQMTRNKKIILSAVAVLVLLAIYVLFDRKHNTKEEPIIPITSGTASTTVLAGTGVTITGNGDYKIEQVSIDEGKAKSIPMPDLTRPVTFGGNTYTQEVKDAFITKIKALQATLKQDPTDLMSWIELGVYQKSIGDYAGAAITWKYVAAVADHDYISYGNLGDLYAYYLKDNAMAEAYYKTAIANGPTKSYLYLQLALVYKDVFKDMDKARAIVNQGLTKIPNDPSLLELKKNLG
jgi:hypothetical protein